MFCIREERRDELTKKFEAIFAGLFEHPLYKVASYKDINGQHLSNQMAAGDIISIVKSIVAVSFFITFSALALHENPHCSPKLKSGDTASLERFSEEVRRYYPLAPFIGARARKDFIWNNCQFKEGMLVVLDLFGTNHDPHLWESPEKFQPNRFIDRKENLFDFIPQGGGEPAHGHRCPGERITVQVIKASVDFLVNSIEFEIPNQDFSYNLARMPSLPESGFVISNIRRKNNKH